MDCFHLTRQGQSSRLQRLRSNFISFCLVLHLYKGDVTVAIETVDQVREKCWKVTFLRNNKKKIGKLKLFQTRLGLNSHSKFLVHVFNWYFNSPYNRLVETIPI